MINSDTTDYQLSNINCDSRFAELASNDRDYSNISWHNVCSERTPISSPSMSHGVAQVSKSQTSSADNFKSEPTRPLDDGRMCSSSISQLLADDSEPRSISRSSYFPRPRITAMKLKSFVSKEAFNNLPLDVRQNLTSLMPDCDRIVTGQTTDDKFTNLSNTALNNEFFNRALVKFLWKLSNGKSVLSTESFINKIKCTSRMKVCKMTANSNSDESIENVKIKDIPHQDSTVIRSDCDISDAKVNYYFGPECSIFSTNREIEDQLNIKKENHVASPNNSFDISFLYNSGNSPNNTNNSRFEIVEKEFADYIPNHSPQPILSPISDSSIAPRSGKYKRRNSESSLAPTPHKRPTRSTAGQLPARLKSSSPQPGSQDIIISALLNKSHSNAVNKLISCRKKSTEKRKYKPHDCNGPLESKPTFLHNDTILMNLRTKLSNRIQRNSLKDYSDQYMRSKSTVDSSSDNNGFNSKSPGSLSPESDKLPFLNSPLSRNCQTNFRTSKIRNACFDNQTPISPQWSYSSEFTSQSSVESVLSQKNIRIDMDDLNGSENFLDDIDSEEMPPPRKTLTVAAIREKMRAKKMAKEEKREDFDKDCSFEVYKIDNSSISEKHSEASIMSSMVSMARDDNDDDEDNIADEFDSFLIDDYHVEIDDKILNYSDDLDDLLLSGGNESLLEIIMKDPDAMDIANDSFSTLNSECQHSSTLVSSDQTKYSFSNANIMSQCSAFTNHMFETNTVPSVINHQVASPVSSVSCIDNSILSQALTSAINKTDAGTFSSKDSSTNKTALQNAYLVDGNGLSDALKLIQSLHPGAKVTTQQFFLVNSGPQLVLSQAPPTQAYSSPTVNAQSSIKSTHSTTNVTTHTQTSSTSSSDSNTKINNALSSTPNTMIFNNSKPTTAFNQAPVLSSTLSMLPQFSAFNTKPSNIYSVNSNFTNNLSNLGPKFPANNVQYQAANAALQHSPLLVNQKSISSNQNAQNTIGIRLQLAQNFQNGQHMNILQPAQSHVIPTLMNQPLQFISPQHSNSNSNNNNISLITQSQPMSKLVLLYPNMNCQQLSADIGKPDSQQVIFLSQPQKDQMTPLSLAGAQTFQVLNGANIWQQINPNIGTLLGPSSSNNLVLMNPQALNNQSFSFNYHQASPLLAGSNLLMMSTPQGLKPAQLNNQKFVSNPNKMVSTPISTLSISVTKPDEEKPNSVVTNLNSNSSQNSCVEQLSNSSSSANSKLSFDDKSSCQLSKSHSDNLTDSDQEKSVNSPQFPLFGTEHHSQIANGTDSSTKLSHLTVDIDSPSASNSFYEHKISAKSISSQNDDRQTIRSPDSDYDPLDFEIPCLYSHKIEGKGADDRFGRKDARALFP